MTGRKWLATGIALALLAVGLWWASRAGDARDEGRARLAERARLAAEHAALEEESAALRESLAAEREARLALEALVEELRGRGREPGAAAAGAPLPGPADPERAEPREARGADPAGTGADVAAAPAGAGDPAAGPQAPASPPVPAFFDEARLEARGLAPGEVARLRERFEEAEMEALYLQDQAAREGWLRKPRFGMAQVRLQRELRADVGDESYDLMLWAAGRPNRVKLLHVLHSSPASDAGLEAGDVVLSYGDERIFTPFDVQHGTRTAKAGSQVSVEVLRSGEGVIRVFLPAGPMGAQLGPVALPPQGPGG